MRGTGTAWNRTTSLTNHSSPNPETPSMPAAGDLVWRPVVDVRVGWGDSSHLVGEDWRVTSRNRLAVPLAALTFISLAGCGEGFLSTGTIGYAPSDRLAIDLKD